MIEEQELITRAQRGDASAFDALVRLFETIAFRTACLVTRDPSEAADATQEAFMRAYRAIRSFKLGQPFRPWLLRIVTNVSLNRLKAASRRTKMAERFTLETLVQEKIISPDHAVVEEEQNARLVQAVERLAPEEQRLLSLRYFLELPEAEVAGVLNLPRGTVKSRLHRTLARLRAIVKSEFPDLRELVS